VEIDQEKVNQLRTLVRNGSYFSSKHALDRMSERCIRLDDAIDAILNGKCFAQEIQEGDLPPRFHFASRDGAFTVVAAADCPVILVTVFFEK